MSDLLSFINEGISLLKQGKYQKALELFQSFNNQYPVPSFLLKVYTNIGIDNHDGETEKAESQNTRFSLNGVKANSSDSAEFMSLKQEYFPNINDRDRVNVASVQKTGVLAAYVMSKNDVERWITDQNKLRADL